MIKCLIIVSPLSRGCCTTLSLAHKGPCCRPSSPLVFRQHSLPLLLHLSPLLGWDKPLLSSALQGRTALNTEATELETTLRVTVDFYACSFTPLALWATHSVGPLGEVPVGNAGAHVALLTSIWAEPRVALVIVHDAALIANAAHSPHSSPHSTVDRALRQTEWRKRRNQTLSLFELFKWDFMTPFSFVLSYWELVLRKWTN